MSVTRRKTERAPTGADSRSSPPSLSPRQHYQQLLQSGQIHADVYQAAAVDAFDELYQALLAQPRRSRWRQFLASDRSQLQGLYLWGGVGRGKTWLMDLFFESVAIKSKRRIHFHRFMQSIHAGLRKRPHESDPLHLIAAEWSQRCRLLCLDEFFVIDIADAMLLAGLLEALFKHGVVLVTTSNLPPDELYRDGLQRSKFLPAIKLLKTHCRVLQLAGDMDFRLRILEQSQTYHVPLGEQAEKRLELSFQQFSGGFEVSPELRISQRRLRPRRRADGVIWFDFSELCEQPRGNVDYIEIARTFNTVLISHIPMLGDEFYDRGVKLLVSAAAGPHDLYSGERLSFEFERCASRLVEMQTHDYLARPHLP